MQYTFVMEFNWPMIFGIVNRKKENKHRKDDGKSICLIRTCSTMPYTNWISVLPSSFFFF